MALGSLGLFAPGAKCSQKGVCARSGQESSDPFEVGPAEAFPWLSRRAARARIATVRRREADARPYPPDGLTKHRRS